MRYIPSDLNYYFGETRMKKLLLSSIILILAGGPVSAITTASGSAAVEQKRPVVTEAAGEEKVEAPAPTEDSETIYFDAVDLQVDEVEVDSEGDIESL